MREAVVVDVEVENAGGGRGGEAHEGRGPCTVREVTVTKADGEPRTFEARSSDLVPVSRRAFVERKAPHAERA
jgi:hypothetical protein